MKERPILFSGPMVQAILNGAKTQTRRVIKPQPLALRDGLRGWKSCAGGGYEVVWNALQMSGSQAIGEFCPYGKPGDQLWVRETWRVNGNEHDYAAAGPDKVFYRADEDWNGDAGWRPSIFMPRWASRITLEVTGVRVECIREISEADMIAEGIDYLLKQRGVQQPNTVYRRIEFVGLWDKINTVRGYGWGSNPYVWAVEFRVVQP